MMPTQFDWDEWVRQFAIKYKGGPPPDLEYGGGYRYSQVDLNNPDIPPIIPGHDNYLTYGTASSSAKPLEGSLYGMYGGTDTSVPPDGVADTVPALYGRPYLEPSPPLLIEAEDARALVMELYPNRVNHVRDPAFRYLGRTMDDSGNPLGVGHRWRTSKGDPRPADSVSSPLWLEHGTSSGTHGTGPPPWSDTCANLSPGDELFYGSFSSRDACVWVSPSTPDGSSGADAVRPNWWKVSLVTDSREAVYAGMVVLDREGALTVREVEVYPRPLPWDVDTVADPDIGTHCLNPHPYSKSGWYVMYAVMDVGSDSVWGVPVVGLRNWSPSECLVTDLCIENWDTVDLLHGPGTWRYNLAATEGAPFRMVASGATPAVGDPNSFDNMSIDPLISFHGGMATRHFDSVVWMGEDANSATGYYPQRRIRHEGAGVIMRNYTPVGRTLSLKYVYERP